MIMAGLNKFYVDNKFPQEFRLRKVETSGNELSDVHQFDYISLRTNDSSASYGESYFDKSVRNNQKFGRYSYCYIGGGFVVCTGDTLTLFGKSEAVGSVPYRLLELFRLEILSFYREDRPFLRRISIEVPRESKHDGDKGVAFLDELLEPTTDGTGNPGDRLLRDDLLESISRRNELSPESETESETEYTSKPSGLEID